MVLILLDAIVNFFSRMIFLKSFNSTKISAPQLPSRIEVTRVSLENEVLMNLS